MSGNKQHKSIILSTNICVILTSFAFVNFSRFQYRDAMHRARSPMCDQLCLAENRTEDLVLIYNSTMIVKA